MKVARYKTWDLQLILLELICKKSSRYFDLVELVFRYIEKTKDPEHSISCIPLPCLKEIASIPFGW
jgi:hypothetical protein